MDHGTDERTGARATPARPSALRTLFDRRSTTRGSGTIWRRRISSAKAAGVIVTAVATAIATLIGAIRHANVGSRSPRDVVVRVDSTLAALDNRTASLDSRTSAIDSRTASLEHFRDTVNAFRAEIQKIQDSMRSDQRMTNYMLCVMIRRSDPASAPPGCDPVRNVGAR